MKTFRLVAMASLIMPILTHCKPAVDQYLPGYDSVPQEVIVAQTTDYPYTQMEV